MAIIAYLFLSTAVIFIGTPQFLEAIQERRIRGPLPAPKTII